MSIESKIPLVSLEQIEPLISQYIECWKTHGPRIFDIGDETLRTSYLSNIQTDCERNFLIVTKFEMHKLSYEAFNQMPILLLRTQKYQVNQDHYYYWSYAMDVYEYYKELALLPFFDNEISNRVKLLMGVLLLNDNSMFRGPDRMKINAAVESLMPHLQKIRMDSFLIAAHLTYPLVEGVARRMLSEYMESDGKLKDNIPAFLSNDGKQVTVNSNRINRINILLRLIESKTSNIQLRNNMKLFREEFEIVYITDPDLKCYDLIDEKRNQLLHGERYWEKFFGALINLLCLLVNSAITKENYEAQYEEIIKRINMNIQTKSRGFNSPWGTYYPPFL
ncbi:hypothetical protein [Candidatus Nitrosocosmicus sp. T]